MRKLFFCGLESYESRYTLQLTEWNKQVFQRRAIDVEYVNGQPIDNTQSISVGQVLDAHGRSYFSLSQMMNLIQMMKQGHVTNQDIIYFEDMYTPGFDALGYILDQVVEEYRPRIFVRCLAQTIDPDDFLHVWSIDSWMRHYEQVVNNIVLKSKGAILASSEEMVAHMKIAGWTALIYNISGLAFGKNEVKSRVPHIKPFDQRTRRVGFGARWDQEKQPDFYMDLIEEWHQRFEDDTVEFAVYTGSSLRSNYSAHVHRAKDLAAQGKLVIYENLKKNDYYNLLNDTRVLFNCALQDWVSNTVSEADALGSNVLFPAYRSFPETFANDHERLYVPWSMDDAINKLKILLDAPHPNIGKISNWTDGTIDRICDIMEGNGEQWRRDNVNYRMHTLTSKY
jgi:hypothetical protein